jgi:hypothetical protein
MGAARARPVVLVAVSVQLLALTGRSAALLAPVR